MSKGEYRGPKGAGAQMGSPWPAIEEAKAAVGAPRASDGSSGAASVCTPAAPRDSHSKVDSSSYQLKREFSVV